MVPATSGRCADKALSGGHLVYVYGVAVWTRSRHGHVHWKCATGLPKTRGLGRAPLRWAAFG